jgi:hypothetical protein
LLFLRRFVSFRPRIPANPTATNFQGPELSMFDAILIAAGVGFFVLAIVYTVACDQL